MWGGVASLQDGAGAASGSVEAGSSVERTNASESTWESELAMISEFDLGSALVTRMTPVMTHGDSGAVRAVRGLYRERRQFRKRKWGLGHS